MRSYGSRRGRSGGPSLRIWLIGAGVVVVAMVGGVFWFAHKAESNAPEQRQIRVEAQNVVTQ